MTSTYATMISWMDEFKEHPERWTNHGRDILRNSCSHHDADESNKKDFDNRNEQDKKDYTEEQFEEWCKDSFKSSNVEYQDSCSECDISEDDCDPMMNYAYPLEIEPGEEAILKVVKNTPMTILENQDTGDYFLALCGGGMDFSQSIALAYTYAQRWIPADLLLSVTSQPCLSVGREEYKELAKEIIYQLKKSADDFKARAKGWEESLKDFKRKEVEE